jgi:hypothetical protein
VRPLKSIASRTKGLSTKLLLSLDRSKDQRSAEVLNSRWWSPELVLFAVVVVVAIALLTVPLPVDPMDYLEAAQNPGDADPDHLTTRIGLVLPTWVISLLFGYSEVTFYTVPILGTAGLAVATAVAGRHIFNRSVGLGAGTLVVLSPFVLPYATQLLPDVSSAALVTLSFALVAGVASTRGEEPPERDFDVGSIVTLFRSSAFLAGLIIGGAYLIRETALLYLPALVAFAAILGCGRQFIGKLLASSMMVAVAAALIGALLWGDPLARVHAVLGRSATPPTAAMEEASEAAFALQSDVFSSASVVVNLLWSSDYGRFVLAMGIFLLVGALVRRSRLYLALLVWIAIPWAIFAVVGSIRPESGRVIIRLTLDRYWASLIPPFLIGGLGMMSEFVGWVKPPLIRKLSIAAVALMTGLAAVAGVAFSFERRHDYFIHLGNDHLWQLRDSLAGVTGEPTITVPRRPAALIRLFTNDSIGRSVFGGTLVKADPTIQPSPEWVVLDFVHGGPSTPSAELMNGESEYRVYDAERDLKWALLTTAVDGPTHFGGETVLGQFTDDRWMERRIGGSASGGDVELPVGRVEVAQGETLVVFDDTADYGRPPEEPRIVIPRGSVVSVQADVTVEGGEPRVACDFFDVQVPFDHVRVYAATVFADEPMKDSLFALCRAPDTDGKYALRLSILVAGPAQLRMGVVRVSFYEPLS